MQKIWMIMFVTMATVAIVCCSKKKNVSTEEHKASSQDASAAMEAYHELMAESFHPFMDSGNLQPAKAHADELASAAERWAELGSSGETDNVLKSKLLQLKVNSLAFANLAQDGADDTVGKSLENLHHEFHEAMELWSNEPKEHPSK